MAFYWSDYLAAAQQWALATTPLLEEAILRSAISRAYYAAFHEARDYLANHGDTGIPTGGRAHAYVRDRFRNDPDTNRQQIGQYLDRMRLDRNRADYIRPQAGIAAMTQVNL